MYSIYLGHVDVIVVLIIFNFDEPVLSLHQMAFFFVHFRYLVYSWQIRLTPFFKGVEVVRELINCTESFVCSFMRNYYVDTTTFKL